MKLSEKTWHRARDAILFFSGLIGVGYETIAVSFPQPTLLIIFAAMMGLPAFLQGASQVQQITDKELQAIKDERDKALALLNAQSEVTQRLLDTSEKWSHMG